MRPSIDSYRPPRVCTLFATATWVCRSGSGAGVAVGERGGDQPGDVDLAYPARTLPGEQRPILYEPQRGRDCSLMGLLDLRGDRQVSDRPQR
jgi:hypothetical protein